MTPEVVLLIVLASAVCFSFQHLGPVVFRSRLATCESAFDWRIPVSRPADCTSCLRIVGLGQERRFVNYHRVLSRARWQGCKASRLLSKLLVQRFVPAGPIVLGIDDTIECRRGKRIQAKSIYCDPLRSTHSHFVKASGLRWVSLMLLGSDILGGSDLGTAVSHLSCAE